MPQLSTSQAVKNSRKSPYLGGGEGLRKTVTACAKTCNELRVYHYSRKLFLASSNYLHQQQLVR
jgi:hypothetical protein